MLEENKKEWRQLGGKATFKFPKWILQKWGRESGGGKKDEPGGGDDWARRPQCPAAGQHITLPCGWGTE